MARTMATTSDAAMRKKTPLHVSIFLIHDTSLAAMKFRLPSLFASFAAGALAVAGFAPLSWWPLAILSLAALFALAARADGWRAGFKLGFAYGLGLFLVGVSWIYVSLSVYGGMAPWLAALAVLLFAAYLALWPALAAALVAGTRGVATWRLVVFAPAAWVLTEWARGWVFTGFPWLGLGYPQVAGPLGGFAPLLGTYGVSWLAALVAGLLAWGSGARHRRVAQVAAAVVLVAGAALRAVAWTTPAGAPTTVALLQGNVPQDMKWLPEKTRETLELYLRLARQARARLIVLPETALPLFERQLPHAVREEFAAIGRANGGDVLIGLPTGDVAADYYNSVLSLGASASQRYHKVHLVPFGEYIPLKPLFGWILEVLHIPLSDFTRGAPGQPPLAVGGQKVAADICYEDTFGEEIVRPLPEATALVNVSNLAWFGDTLAPWQHLQMSQMRALETGRMMLRATNTGATAIVDRDGRLISQLPLFETGILRGEMQGYAGATPYARWGNAPVLALLFALAGVAAWATRR